MAENTDIYCSTCFAMPGESCVSKYLVHGDDVLTPVVCPTHPGRVVDSERAQWHRDNLSPRPLMLGDGQ
jgi:hypothetical protein